MGYPGGAVIEKLARDGNVNSISFPRAYLSKKSLDFSFSGVKTAVSLYVEKWRKSGTNDRSTALADIAASFQESVVDVLVAKLLMAMAKTGVRSVAAAGGVACNKRLRDKLLEAAANAGGRVYYPRPGYCTDNGAMIAVAGYHRLLHGERADHSMDVRSKYPISDLPALNIG